MTDSSATPVDAVRRAADAACARIAPTWPLDQFIAVNPLWEYRDQPIETAAARWGALGGIRLAPGAPSTALQVLPLLVDAHDTARNAIAEHSGRRLIGDALGQFFAAWFDRDFARWPLRRDGSMYACWRDELARNPGLPRLLGHGDWTTAVQSLPDSADQLPEYTAARLALDLDACEAYFEAALLSVLGWASWASHLRWEARLQGRTDDSVQQLLAIRLAFECLVDDGARGAGSVHANWSARWADWRGAIERVARTQAPAWLALRRREDTYRSDLLARLTPARLPKVGTTPITKVQAVFCIDVRSEPLRRALEATSPAISTHGFAGFFGLPISYRALGSEATPAHLPGLLAPTLEARESSGSAELDAALALRRRRQLSQQLRHSALGAAPSSMFHFVEATGLTKLPALLGHGPGASHGLHVGAESDGTDLRPRLPDLPGNADLAASILRAMGLTTGFARLLLLVGHASTSSNNPHAAGLDCGACRGRSGEINARALADLLNRREVRDGLCERGIDLPDTTWAVAARHDTTLDAIDLLDIDMAPASHRDDLHRLQAVLDQAGRLARAERAPALGLGHLIGDPQALQRAMRRRAIHWAQTRPEWGLAGNAALIVAPRERTRGADLGGRCFLHDYRWQDDPDATRLSAILAAPMVVAQWINFQYFASTVDNDRLGSGNKLLHNVVGGTLGVFEGNGGDLRIGLPRQSLHDGRRWIHEPLRLTVLVDAPQAMLDRAVQAEPVVAALAGNGWLTLRSLQAELATARRPCTADAAAA